MDSTWDYIHCPDSDFVMSQYILLSRNDGLAGIGKQESTSWNAQINNKYGEEQARIYIAQTSLNCADTTLMPRVFF